VDAWVNNQWKEIATAANVGYKRILRFPAVTSAKFRIRIIASRLQPAIANVSAHYYENRPPQLAFSRNLEGMLTIHPKKHAFGWKPHGEDVMHNINSDVEIRYTLDGRVPTAASKLYTEPFLLESGEVKACAFTKKQTGSVASELLGIIKKDWKVLDVDNELGKNKGAMAFDEDVRTYWQSSGSAPHHISIDLGKVYVLKGFTYTPQLKNSEGMIEEGLVKISDDGKTWKEAGFFKFGNLINDPTPRRHFFKHELKTRFVRIESIVIAGGKQSAAIAEIEIIGEK
jgi:alpha-L-fucosidase